MRKIWKIALIFIAISLHWTGASGQTVYKCGNGYSQAPCPGGTPVQASDSRTPQDKAQADANFVLTGKGGIVEIQGTAEQDPFSEDQFLELLKLAKKGIGELSKLQRAAVGLD